MKSRDIKESDQTRIVRAVLRLARQLRHPLSDKDPRGSALGILAALQREGSMSAANLARSEGLKAQSVSLVLARLERDKLIKRLIDELDRRRHKIMITAAGRATLLEATNRRHKWLEEAMARDLSESECKTIVQAAGLMLKIVERS